ncbi:MAG: hypothetical protein MRERV_35c039 [Mycoplasmataceae bacterium RV_VA103A]|nr:MAG: hypothetical protein MRERV_35c039 [Mycoplasmataceae bacterium RV_VA103A]
MFYSLVEKKKRLVKYYQWRTNPTSKQKLRK